MHLQNPVFFFDGGTLDPEKKEGGFGSSGFQRPIRVFVVDNGARETDDGQILSENTRRHVEKHVDLVNIPKVYLVVGKFDLNRGKVYFANTNVYLVFYEIYFNGGEVYFNRGNVGFNISNSYLNSGTVGVKFHSNRMNPGDSRLNFIMVEHKIAGSLDETGDFVFNSRV